MEQIMIALTTAIQENILVREATEQLDGFFGIHGHGHGFFCFGAPKRCRDAPRRLWQSESTGGRHIET